MNIKDIKAQIGNYSLSRNDLTRFFKERYWLVILIAIFIVSFSLDIVVLTRYSLSYGIDGAFYDIQIRNILHYGFPMSNDPPLAYYLLTPFSLLVGNSFLGIKIGMAFLGSLLAFPAYYLTELYVKNNHSKVTGTKIPALLSAFMITINVNYFALISDFMQNLVGVLFLSIFLYFAIKWLENIEDWRKYGVLTIVLLSLNLLTHIYTGALAVILFFGLLIFSILFKSYKTRKLPVFDLKILGLLSALVVVIFVVLFLVYPVMYTKYGTVFSFINSTSSVSSGRSVSSPVNGIIFFSIPYLLGIAASAIILYRGLKEKVQNQSSVNLNKSTLLSGAYILLAAVLAILVIIPASDYQSRFLLIAFLPIALLVPLGLKFLETEFLTKYPTKKIATTLLVLGVSLIFAFSCYFTASESFDHLAPTISTDEYNELVQLKASFQNSTDTHIVILASDFQTKYWVEYVLGDLGNGKTVTVVESANDIPENYKNSTIYSVTSNGQSSQLSGLNNNPFGNSQSNSQNKGLNSSNQVSNQVSNLVSGSGMNNSLDNNGDKVNNSNNSSSGINGTHGNNVANPASSGPNQSNGNGGPDQTNNYDLSILLPYGPPLLPNSWDKLIASTSGSTNGQNPMKRGDQSFGNNTNSTMPQNGNLTSNVPGAPPGGMISGNNSQSSMQSPGTSSSGSNQGQGPPGTNNMGSSSNGQSQNNVQSLTSSGTTIYSGKYFKIVKIKL